MNDRKLTTMGKAWFVSYEYWNKIDRTHTNWDLADTIQPRFSAYRNSTAMHKQYLEWVIGTDDWRLETNDLGLSAYEIKRMARELLRMP